MIQLLFFEDHHIVVDVWYSNTIINIYDINFSMVFFISILSLDQTSTICVILLTNILTNRQTIGHENKTSMAEAMQH